MGDGIESLLMFAWALFSIVFATLFGIGLAEYLRYKGILLKGCGRR